MSGYRPGQSAPRGGRRRPITEAISAEARELMVTLAIEIAETDRVIIAVVDSGFDLRHPDLNFVPRELHFNAAEQVRDRSSGLPLFNRRRYDAGISRRTHGIGVAGIAAARPVVRRQGLGTVTVQGIAPGFPVMPIKLGLRPTPAHLAASVRWAVDHGARVINVSLKTPEHESVAEALEGAWAAGVLVCAAAGNYSRRHPSQPVDFPASHPRTIAVGATDGTGRRKQPDLSLDRDWGSQHGPELDVVAQGISVPTLDERGQLGAVRGDFLLNGIGTSLAAPQVAGLAAMIMSVQPQLSVEEVKDMIEGTCHRLPDYRFGMQPGRKWPWNEEVGYGQVDFVRCLNQALTGQPPVP